MSVGDRPIVVEGTVVSVGVVQALVRRRTDGLGKKIKFKQLSFKENVHRKQSISPLTPTRRSSARYIVLVGKKGEAKNTSDVDLLPDLRPRVEL